MRSLLVAWITLFNTQLFAQQSITGRVVDAETGEGLIGAHVYLLNDWRKGAISNPEGMFSMVLSEKNFKDSIIVSYVGFEERVLPVSNDLVIELKELKVIGKTVTVTAKSLIAEEFQYMELNKIEIYTNPAAKADPILAVNSLPSATTTDESANISLRGSSPVETGIFLNNVPVYDAVRYSQLNGIGTFSIFNTAIIENMMVFPGNPPLEFGNVTSGVVSMNTDQRILDGSTNSVILSLANVGFSREQQLNENQSMKLFTNWQPSRVVKNLNPKALEDIKRFNSNDFGLYWYGSNKKINWKILSYSNIEGYQFHFEHPSFSGDFDQEKVRSFLTSSVQVPLGKGELSINNGASFSKGDYSYSNVSFKVDKEDLFAGINYHLDQANFSLKTGISFDQRVSEVAGNFHQFGFALDVTHPTVTVNEGITLQTLEGFTYLKYYLNDDLTIGSGLRKNIPTDSLNYLSSQLNLAYRKGRWSTTFGVGKYHKTGLFENSGEPFHAANTQISMDVNYEYKGLQSTLSIFDKKGRLNGETYWVRGMELFTDYRLTDKLSTSGSITWLNAKNNLDAPFIYDINYFLRANLAYKPGNFWTIETILNGRQGVIFNEVSSSSFNADLNVYQPFYTETDNRLSDYWNIGLSVSKVFLISEDFNFITFASLNNVFDHDNVRGYQYSIDYSSRKENLFSQRTGYFGVILNF